jgi:glycerate dehydrogenase
MCRDGAVILNLGRGGIIDEEAVSRIIDQRELYFGLDVLSLEPMKQEHPLLSVKNRDNLYITPHIAWASAEARAKLIEGVVYNIKSFLEQNHS